MSQIFKEFVRHIQKHGLASSNRWRVDIPLPQKVQNLIKDYTTGLTTPTQQQLTNTQFDQSKTEANRNLELMCISAPFPGSNIDTHPALHNGFKRHMPYAETHDVIDLIFYCTSGMYEKYIFELWKNTVFNMKTRKVGFYDDYVTDIMVHQLNENEQIKHSVKIIEAFPAVQTPIILDRTSDKQINQLSVSFNYLKTEKLDEFTTTAL